MKNSENLRTLADTAYEGKNYDQAYQYYSQLLEIDPSDARAWLGKGLSAGWISTPSNQKLDELIVNVRQALRAGLDDQEKGRVAEGIFAAAKSYVKKAEAAFDKGMLEFDKKEIAPDVLAAVHNIGRISYKLSNGREQASGWMKALETMEYACEIVPSIDGYKTVLEEIDKLILHSKQNSVYLEHGKDEELNRLPRVLQNRVRIIQKAKELDPNFQPQATPTSGGCFIATATMGDYNHPYVLELRKFRDDVLFSHKAGRLFIHVYYRLSPPAADFIKSRSWLRQLIRGLLIRPIVGAIQKGGRAKAQGKKQ